MKNEEERQFMILYSRDLGILRNLAYLASMAKSGGDMFLVSPTYLTPMVLSKIETAFLALLK